MKSIYLSVVRTAVKKALANPKLFKLQLLNWAQHFREIVFLDSNEFNNEFTNYDCILAIEAFTSIKTDYFNAFEDLKQYQQASQDWLFGYLSYDLKNDVEKLVSINKDGLHFPEIYFFQPKKIYLLKGNTLEICYLNFCEEELEADYYEINNQLLKNDFQNTSIAMTPRISKSEYIEKISKMLHYIHHGAIYEANFCMEFYAENTTINPLEKFINLNEISQSPFAVFFKNHTHFLLSASPERYLKKEGDILISQPIKGTSKRFSDTMEDENSKKQLVSDPKERAENIMITDIVRNDLSRTAQKGSVVVNELCKVYSFLQVHHMITTITSKMATQYSTIDAIKTTFPMGSMTGAPKIAAMQIIEELEETKRGLYSGSVGYFTPNGNFDFNVIIRSILFNQQEKYVSFSVGSAITSQSIPEKEYQECMLKAKAMFQVLGSKF